MEVFSFFRSHLFELFTLFGALTIAFKQPKRRHGWLFFSAAMAVDILCVILWSFYMRNHKGSMTGSLVRYIGQFLLVLVIVYSWLDCKLLTAVFVVTTGYSMQQLGGRVCTMMSTLFLPASRSKAQGVRCPVPCAASRHPRMVSAAFSSKMEAK